MVYSDVVLLLLVLFSCIICNLNSCMVIVYEVFFVLVFGVKVVDVNGVVKFG